MWVYQQLNLYLLKSKLLAALKKTKGHSHGIFIYKNFVQLRKKISWQTFNLLNKNKMTIIQVIHSFFVYLA